MKRLVRFGVALAAILSPLVPPMAAHADVSSVSADSGAFVIRIDLGAGTPPIATPKLPARAGLTRDFILSDNHLRGTFITNFLLTSRGVPKFDSFDVKNTTSRVIVLTVIDETRNIVPARADRNLAELKACFNALCDLSVTNWIPSGVQPPPFPLASIPPGQTQHFKVGFQLDPNADVIRWNQTGLTTVLQFAAK